MQEYYKENNITESQNRFHAPNKINHEFISTFKKSCIIITNDFQKEINYLKNTHDREFLKIFEEEELKINHVHEIIQEAHIATHKDTIVAIFAYSYNKFAQNALLKILEEPPPHIIFMLHIDTRNKLMPTILSRLVVFNKKNKKNLEDFELDITRLNIPVIYNYIKKLEKENTTHEKGRIILAQILQCIAQNNIFLNEEKLERFDLAIKALHSKQSVHFAILPILLSLVKR